MYINASNIRRLSDSCSPKLKSMIEKAEERRRGRRREINLKFFTVFHTRDNKQLIQETGFQYYCILGVKVITYSSLVVK